MITISFSSASSMQLKKSPKFRQLFQESFKMSKWNGRYSPGFPHCYSTFLKGRRDPDLKRRVKLNYIIPHICHPSFHSFNSVALITFNRLSLCVQNWSSEKNILEHFFLTRLLHHPPPPFTTLQCFTFSFLGPSHRSPISQSTDFKLSA